MDMWSRLNLRVTMFGVKRSFGIAVLCAVGAAIAAPAGVVGAQVPANERPIVDMSPEPDGVPVAVGESITFTVSATDPEGGTITWGEWYSLGSGLYNAHAEVDPTGTKWKVTCDSEGPYFFTLDAIDEAGAVATLAGEVVCRVRPTGALDPAPAVPGKRTVVPLGTTVEFTRANRGEWADYEWRTTGVPGVAGTGSAYSRTFDQPGNFGVELYETNELGTAKQWVGYTVIDSPTVSVSPAPADPKARMRVPLGSTVTFDGSRSRGHAGGSLAYRWSTTGTSGVAGNGTTFARRFDKPGNFGVELIVKDRLGQTARRWVGVTVFKSEAPVVSVAPAPKDPKARLEVKVGKTLTFDGRGSRDPDGGSLTYRWRTTGVRGIAGTGGTFIRKFDKTGLYGVELTVTDDEGQTSKRWVGLTVVP